MEFFNFLNSTRQFPWGRGLPLRPRWTHRTSGGPDSLPLLWCALSVLFLQYVILGIKPNSTRFCNTHLTNFPPPPPPTSSATVSFSLYFSTAILAGVGANVPIVHQTKMLDHPPPAPSLAAMFELGWIVMQQFRHPSKECERGAASKVVLGFSVRRPRNFTRGAGENIWMFELKPTPEYRAVIWKRKPFITKRFKNKIASFF